MTTGDIPNFCCGKKKRGEAGSQILHESNQLEAESCCRRQPRAAGGESLVDCSLNSINCPVGSGRLILTGDKEKSTVIQDGLPVEGVTDEEEQFLE